MPATRTVAAGTRVMLQPGLRAARARRAWRAATTSARRTKCSAFGPTAATPSSSRCRCENLVPIPAHIDFVTAAAFPLTFLTAWHMLVTRAGTAARRDVLVLAGGSGVGQAAIQIARYHGARVLATAASSQNRAGASARGRGGARPLRQRLLEEVRRLTNGRGVDVVVEHVGEATWDRSVRALASGGRLVTCGATTGPGQPSTSGICSRGSCRFSVRTWAGMRAACGRARCLFAGTCRPVVDPCCRWATRPRHSGGSRTEASSARSSSKSSRWPRNPGFRPCVQVAHDASVYTGLSL